MHRRFTYCLCRRPTFLVPRLFGRMASAARQAVLSLIIYVASASLRHIFLTSGVQCVSPLGMTYISPPLRYGFGICPSGLLTLGIALHCGKAADDASNELTFHF